jgi:glutathione peroxidase
MRFFVLYIFLLSIGLNIIAQESISMEKDPQYSVYQFTAIDIEGKEFDFSCLEGQKIIIVNTGSKCRFRGQLREMQKLYSIYRDSGLVVIAFPSNNFFFREPGSNSKIKRRYNRKFGITFPIMAKVNVRGNGIEPLFDFLSDKQKNGRFDAPPAWNFQKYLICEDGILYKTLSPSVSILDENVIDWILNKPANF